MIESNGELVSYRLQRARETRRERFRDPDSFEHRMPHDMPGGPMPGMEGRMHGQRLGGMEGRMQGQRPPGMEGRMQRRPGPRMQPPPPEEPPEEEIP